MKARWFGYQATLMSRSATRRERCKLQRRLIFSTSRQQALSPKAASKRWGMRGKGKESTRELANVPRGLFSRRLLTYLQRLMIKSKICSSCSHMGNGSEPKWTQNEQKCIDVMWWDLSKRFPLSTLLNPRYHRKPSFLPKTCLWFLILNEIISFVIVVIILKKVSPILWLLWNTVLSNYSL